MQIKHLQLTMAATALATLFSCNAGNKPSTGDSLIIAKDTAVNVSPADSSVANKNVPAQTDSTAAGLIRKVLVTDLVKNDLKTLTEKDRQFSYGVADINGDGKGEIFVGLKGSYFCGNAGCTVYLLDNEGKKINLFTIVDGPITISENKTKGWNDLIIPSKGVNYAVKFNGKNYPSNPSVQPRFTDSITAESVKVLADNAVIYNF
ncbi:hypothetical protein [Chitinophaga arvensicola]|uniref:FG-GAP repeat-containing protein n=1 Tax=Chitinophaga arvensicola TaxID=29529 RepID=A0A1I0R8G7_9BACT|nr:hypothetical protein [Chitinophaga arvensicola]SEW36836.1 hypothetical protein SAMN04488122_2433 [Chitinophaga arvensicola]